MGPQIRELLLVDEFEKTMNMFELAAWKSFKQVCSGFLDKHCDVFSLELFGYK